MGALGPLDGPWILISQVLKGGAAPPSCHGHERWVDTLILVRIGVVAPRKKVLLQKFDSPSWLSPQLFCSRREISGLWLLVSSVQLSRMIIRPAPHGFADEMGEGADIHHVDQFDALFLHLTYPGAKICLCL